MLGLDQPSKTSVDAGTRLAKRQFRAFILHVSYQLQTDDPYLNLDEERSLIAAAQRGDCTARDRLVLAALPFVRRQLGRLYPDLVAHDLDDLLQDAVPVLVESIGLYDVEHPAKARLYVFARTRIKAMVSRHFRHSKLLSYQDELPELLAHEDPQQQLEESQTQHLVRRVLATLSSQDRALLICRHADDTATSRPELARRLDCPVHVVEYAEKRAIRRFLDAMGAATQPA